MKNINIIYQQGKIYFISDPDTQVSKRCNREILDSILIRSLPGADWEYISPGGDEIYRPITFLIISHVHPYAIVCNIK
ncbi:hypothetical protein QTP88_001628 [Uroleucon formosanum]